MPITNISQAKTRLSSLIKQVQETNEPIIIGKAGKPIAVLSAFKENQSPRKLGGGWEGQVKTNDDFDKIDNELIDNFYESSAFPNQQ